MQLHNVLRTILWILVIPAAIIDIVNNMLRLMGLLVASIVWYILLIFFRAFSMLRKIGISFMLLSDRNIVALCFRASIIVGLHCDY